MNGHVAHRLQPAFALLAGVLFGLGLAVSGMVDPAKVLGFLDVAGRWDPTLLLVIAAALAVATPGFRLVAQRKRPWFADAFTLPARTDIDARLLLGAALFGIGWGIAGLCPGPALVASISGSAYVFAFVLAMVGGFLLHDRWAAREP